MSHQVCLLPHSNVTSMNMQCYSASDKYATMVKCSHAFEFLLAFLVALELQKLHKSHLRLHFNLQCLIYDSKQASNNSRQKCTFYVTIRCGPPQMDTLFVSHNLHSYVCRENTTTFKVICKWKRMLLFGLWWQQDPLAFRHYRVM